MNQDCSMFDISCFLCSSSLQGDHLLPLLVSIGCLCGEEITSDLATSTPPTCPSFPSPRPRAVSSPHELPGCSKNDSPLQSKRRLSSAFKFDVGAYPCEAGTTSFDTCLADEMKHNINIRLEESQELDQGEAVALAMQQQEIARIR